MTIGQAGLWLDIIGFVILYIVGGFSYGSGNYVMDEPSYMNKVFRFIGFFLVILGFVLQLCGSL